MRMPRPATKRDLRSSRSQLQGKIETIFATDALRGDFEAPEGGVFPAVSPLTWRNSALRIAT